MDVDLRMTPLQRTRVEKAAADCGFDLTPQLRDRALVFGSTQFPETAEVKLVEEASFLLRAAPPSLLDGLSYTADGWVEVTGGFAALYDALARVSAACRTMPNRVAERFAVETSALPKSTEAERLVVQRVGQELFRRALLDFWQGRCCVTGLAVPELLRASHIKPWAACDSDIERLNVFNGLLLAPNLDAMFDGGWLTVEEGGQVVLSRELSAEARDALGIRDGLKFVGLREQHNQFLAFHRGEVFRK